MSLATAAQSWAPTAGRLAEGDDSRRERGSNSVLYREKSGGVGARACDLCLRVGFHCEGGQSDWINNIMLNEKAQSGRTTAVLQGVGNAPAGCDLCGRTGAHLKILCLHSFGSASSEEKVKDLYRPVKLAGFPTLT